jgi:hypothetical protein
MSACSEYPPGFGAITGTSSNETLGQTFKNQLTGFMWSKISVGQENRGYWKDRIKIPLREIVVNILDFSLLKISIAVLFLLIFMFLYAAPNDLWPTGPWGVYEGNHGPWRGHWFRFLRYKPPIYIVNKTLWWIFELQFIAIPLSAGGLLLNWKLKRVILLVLQSFFFGVLMNNFYWLID